MVLNALVTLSDTANQVSAINYLIASQLADGDWADVYTTATATRMLAAVLAMDTDAFNQIAGITDQSLRAIINAELGKNAFDRIAQGELQLITMLDLRSTDVTTLAGLGSAANLVSVQVNANTDTSALTGVTIIVDSDSDGIVEVADNCPLISNVDQANLDGDVFGDVCDNDVDGDGGC